MSRRDVEIPPMPDRYYWDRGSKRRPYQGSTVPLTIELGARAFRCVQIEDRDGRTNDGWLNLMLAHEEDRQRSLAKRLAELDRLEAEIMGELGNA
jgi:hypothetical protein